MIHRVYYYLHNRFMGDTDIEAPVPPRSQAYFCSTCGSIWARIAVDDAQDWQVNSVPCSQHTPRGLQDWDRLPGSMLNGFLQSRYCSITSWPARIEYLPPALIEHEFNLVKEQLC